MTLGVLNLEESERREGEPVAARKEEGEEKRRPHVGRVLGKVKAREKKAWVAARSETARKKENEGKKSVSMPVVKLNLISCLLQMLEDLEW